MDLYTRVYRRFYTEYQIALVLPTPTPTFVGIALNRERRDFSEEDRAVLNVARPHLARLHRDLQVQRALRGSLGALQRAVEVSGQGVIVLDAASRARLVSPQAARWLSIYFPSSDGELPPAVRTWLARRRVASTARTTPPPAEPLVIERGGVRLVCRWLPALTPSDHDTIVLEEQAAPAVAAGLTRREREVLTWVARGTRSAEIARALAVRPCTIEKHLERIYAKLGVHSRTAAVAVGLGWQAPTERAAK